VCAFDAFMKMHDDTLASNISLFDGFLFEWRLYSRRCEKGECKDTRRCVPPSLPQTLAPSDHAPIGRRRVEKGLCQQVDHVTQMRDELWMSQRE
jgi:hypothetical protein